MQPSTDSPPQHLDSADTTEDAILENSGTGESSATSEREQSDPVQESVVETLRYVDIIMSLMIIHSFVLI